MGTHKWKKVDHLPPSRPIHSILLHYSHEPPASRFLSSMDVTLVRASTLIPSFSRLHSALSFRCAGWSNWAPVLSFSPRTGISPASSDPCSICFLSFNDVSQDSVWERLSSFSCLIALESEALGPATPRAACRPFRLFLLLYYSHWDIKLGLHVRSQLWL